MFLPLPEALGFGLRPRSKSLPSAVLCALPVILSHVPLEELSLLDGEAHPDRFTGPPCHSDLHLT